MNSRIYLSLIFSLLFSFVAQAQWSVLDIEMVPEQTAFKYQPFTKEEWNSSNFANAEQMKWFTDARYGMFIHFGLSAYVDKDISWQIVENYKAPDVGNGAYPDSIWQKWPSKFELENFDADEWIQIAIDAGMKYVVVIAKHHDGFHMWDTKYSDFKITNTPFGRDYLKEISDACHKVNMPFGIYYSQRDWYHPDYAPVDTSNPENVQNGYVWTTTDGGNPIPGDSHNKYLEYQSKVIDELLTNYGKVDVFWFDAVWWGGMFTAEMWDSENLTRRMRELQPDIIINNRASIPGDFDTPEQEVGRYQSRPWESALTLNGNWAYSANSNYSKERLLRELLSSVQGNGNVLLSWGAHWDGRFNQDQKDLLLSIGDWLRDYGEAFYETMGGPWMPDKWGGATYRENKVYLYVYDWKDEEIVLPEIPNNSISKARYLNVDSEVNYKSVNGELVFYRPTMPDTIATIVELIMKEPISGVISNKSSSIFDGLQYGVLLRDIALEAKDWNNTEKILDLNKIHNITGIGIYESKFPITVYVSDSGKEWDKVGEVNIESSEISLTSYLTGAHVLGKEVRYIKLKSDNQYNGVKLKVYSKN